MKIMKNKKYNLNIVKTLHRRLDLHLERIRSIKEAIKLYEIRKGLNKMKLVVVDVQGFHLPEFIVTELEYMKLSNLQNNSKNWMEASRNKLDISNVIIIHILRFNDEAKDQKSVKQILIEYIKEHGVKGRIKENYLM